MAVQEPVPAVGADRVVRGAALALGLLAAFAWLGLLGHGSMADGAAAMEPSASGALAYLAVWGVMMAAMMLPSAVPMVALYAATARGARVLPTGLFAATYLVAWVLVGVPVYLASVGLAAAADSSDAVMAALPYGAAL